jgi:chitinase
MTYTVCYYYPEWGVYARDYKVDDIPYTKVPEIAYAFFNLAPKDGHFVPVVGDPWAAEQKDGGNFAKLATLAMKRPGIRIGMSIGGWTWSKHFSDAVQTAAARKAFVDECLNFLHKYPFFNVINIDWEYISPMGKNYGLGGNVVRADDGANFVALLKLMKEKFPPKVKVAAAVTAMKSKMDALPVEDIDKYLDEFHLMTYDFDSSAWGPTVANHHTNLYPAAYTTWSVDQSVDAYIERGVDPRKIFIGAAFYSRGFANTNGLGHPANGMVTRYDWDKGVLDYKTIAVVKRTATYAEKNTPSQDVSDYVEYWDDTCKAHYAYSHTKRELISYDTVDSIKHKCDYVKKRGLAGIIVWELSGDVAPTHPKSLVTALYDNLLKDNPAPLPEPEPTPAPEPPLPKPDPTPEPAPEPPTPVPEPKPVPKPDPQWPEFPRPKRIRLINHNPVEYEIIY